MECNRDEAVRAKVIAEGKMETKDYSAAKKFALKAQNLFPGLDGISQMLTTIDVYVSAENKITGEVDWYGVLGVMPSVDDETLRKQYRKLALVLHPDKNKSIGADGAFKLLSEAWSLLSDKAKRLAYNQRRGSRGFQQNVKIRPSGPSAPPRANGFHSSSKRPASAPKAKHTAAPTTVPTPCPKTNDTFWTICHRCKMHYEYLKVYLNNTLLCPNCHEPFLAKETPPPYSHSMSSNSATGQNHQDSSARGSSGQNIFKNVDLKRGQSSRNASGNSRDPSIALAQEKLKRDRDASNFSSTSSKGETLYKKSRVDTDNSFIGNMAHRSAMGNNLGSGSSGSNRGGSEARRMPGFPGNYQKPKSFREVTTTELRNILVEKGRNEIQKKLNEWKPELVAKPAVVKKDKVKAANQAKYIGKQHDMNGIDERSGSKKSDPVKNSCDGASEDVKEDNPVVASMDVPDPDFHDFDLDRSEDTFLDNEVWAAYDDDDGMPRFYAMINKVISRKPFKVKLSWLNSRTNSEFATIDWVGSGFYKTCGEFRIGKYEMNTTINAFSHKVKWFKGPRGTIQIFPKKGEAWALYTNWSPDWNEHTSDEVIHKYEMVLVLNDYNEEQGISVAPLVKVDGFRTVFYPHVDPEKIRRIPKEEMFRFSHRVPNYSLSDEEVKNAPSDCQELDPASTPVELLQVTIEKGPTGNNNGDVMVTERQSTAQVG